MNRVFWIPQTHRAVQQQRKKLSRMVLCRLCVACWLGFPGKSGLHGSKKPQQAKEVAWMCLERERHCKINKLNSSSAETLLANEIFFRCAFGLSSATQHFSPLLERRHPRAAAGTAEEGGRMVPGLKHTPIPQNLKLQKILQPNG